MTKALSNLSITKPSSSLIFIQVNFWPIATKLQRCSSEITCWNSLAPTIEPMLKENFSSLERIWLKFLMHNQFWWARFFRFHSCCHTSPLLECLGWPYMKVIERGLPLVSSKSTCIILFVWETIFTLLMVGKYLEKIKKI